MNLFEFIGRYGAQVAQTGELALTADDAAKLSALEHDARRTREYKAVLDDWLDKTDWMREHKGFGVSSLGMHRADILREEIELLRVLEKRYNLLAGLFITIGNDTSPTPEQEQLKDAIQSAYTRGVGLTLATLGAAIDDVLARFPNEL